MRGEVRGGEERLLFIQLRREVSIISGQIRIEKKRRTKSNVALKVNERDIKLNS